MNEIDVNNKRKWKMFDSFAFGIDEIMEYESIVLKPLFDDCLNVFFNYEVSV